MRIPNPFDFSSPKLNPGIAWQQHRFLYMSWAFVFVWAVRIALMGTLLWCMWRALVAPNPTIDESRKVVADKAVEEIVAALRMHSDNVAHNVVLMHFENDPTDYVSDRLRDAIGKQGGISLRKKSIEDRIRCFLGIANPGIGSRADAVCAARSDGADGVIWGRVERLENEARGATFTGNYEMYDLRRDKPLFAGRVAKSTVPGKFSSGIPQTGLWMGMPAFDNPPQGVSWHIRFLLFVIAALLLPVVTISFIRTMVAKKSNGVNAFVLGIYTTVDLILAFFMVGGSFSSFFAVAVFLLAGVLAFLYNVKIMTFAVRLEE